MARTVKCPGCGADLTVKDDNRDFMFCEFCGTKVRLDDYQETHRFVDEARIQESKDAKELELKKMEQERWRAKESNKSMKSSLAIMIGIIVFLPQYPLNVLSSPICANSLPCCPDFLLSDADMRLFRLFRL